MSQESNEPQGDSQNSQAPYQPSGGQMTNPSYQTQGSYANGFAGGSANPAGGFASGPTNPGGPTSPAGGFGPAAPYWYGAPEWNVASAPTKQKKSHAWIVVIVAIVAFCLVLMFGMWSCSNAFSSPGNSAGSDADLLASDAIAIINIDGTIQYDGTTNSPEGLKSQLDIAADNSHIKGVVLRVNSGGGVATAGEEMATYVREFKENTGKPVVVSSAATNASAAYEISSQADYIYVAKTTSIGSIGTYMQVTDYSGLMELLGITTEDITSAPSKDASSGNRSLTDEERAYYQDQVNQINEVFIENVAEGRDMSIDEVRALATGLTFTGTVSVENGIADEIGTQEDAVAKAAELSGCSSYSIVTLDTSNSDDLDLLLDLMSQSNSTSTDELIQYLKELDNDGSIK